MLLEAPDEQYRGGYVAIDGEGHTHHRDMQLHMPNLDLHSAVSLEQVRTRTLRPGRTPVICARP
jgi:hypothetical protein